MHISFPTKKGEKNEYDPVSSPSRPDIQLQSSKKEYGVHVVLNNGELHSRSHNSPHQELTPGF